MTKLEKPYHTTAIDSLFLELSQFTKASTSKELELFREIARLRALLVVVREFIKESEISTLSPELYKAILDQLDVKWDFKEVLGL